MDLPINAAIPKIMHVDLNSCFATMEQQMSYKQRGKPLVVVAYNSPRGCVIAPSIEAKQYGIKTGMPLQDAKQLYPSVIVRTPTPTLYRDAHLRFRRIFESYTPFVTPKSIDEAVLDFSHVDTQQLHKKTLIEIGFEIKKRIKEELGEWVRCNVGIGTNRFLAKTAASLHKPDGLDVITFRNLEQIYSKLKLLDLCGINIRNQIRCNINGIYTPLQFLHAPMQKLKLQVFHSICGYYWYLRLRGYEIDAVNYKTKSYGQSYALGKKSADADYLSCLLMKLTEKMGYRLRSAGKAARAIHVAILYTDGTYWHKGKTFDGDMFTTDELFKKVMLVFYKQPVLKTVAKLEIRCFDLSENTHIQDGLFAFDSVRKRQVARAVDAINDKWGTWTVYSGLIQKLDDEIVDRIAFGGVKELEEVYAM